MAVFGCKFFIWSTADILITVFLIHSQNIPLERRGKNTKEKVYFIEICCL